MLREGRDPVIACGNGALQLTDVTLNGADEGGTKAEICRSLRQRLI